MKFYTFEYETNISLFEDRIKNTEYTQYIYNPPYLFIHDKKYGLNFHDDWSDEHKKKTITGIAGDLNQLQSQIFILFQLDEKTIYCNSKTKNIITQHIQYLTDTHINISYKLVDIKYFEKKITKLTCLSISASSIKQKEFFRKDFLKFNPTEIDLSEAENFTINIEFSLHSKEKNIKKMYTELIERYNVDNITLNGSNEDNIFEFNKDKVVQNIPINLDKNGAGKIYDYKEVYQQLKSSI